MERIEAKTMITNEDGFHARPAGVFAKAAARFQSTIEIEAKGQKKNAKSIMSVMSLGLKKGDEITLAATGPDAQTAVSELSTLIQTGLPSS